MTESPIESALRWAIRDETALACVAAALCPGTVLSPAEAALVGRSGHSVLPPVLESVRSAILAGQDPLGEAFCGLRSARDRRPLGAVYTPPGLVSAMLGWAAGEAAPDRIVDPGAGSGRFILGAAGRFPGAALVAVELDPLAALTLRANLAVHGLSDRARIIVDDYRSFSLPRITGSTLFIGNPPYVRHHDIPASWKTWFAESAHRVGIRASKLAGLHIHFFFKTMELAVPGDLGCFITSAEWLDVNYGSALRALLADGLGGSALHVVDPRELPFAGTDTTCAISCFRVGNRPRSLRLRAVAAASELADLSAGTAIDWRQVAGTARWSSLLRPVETAPAGHIELGALCRVSRGQVTGDNATWIAGPAARHLPERVLAPTVTKARELTRAGDALTDPASLRRVVDLPPDLDEIDPADRPAVDRFLGWARDQGAADGYVARHRRAWWSVLLYPPPPILCTYMARRPPSFVRNLCGARHLNIAHGLYPRQTLSADETTGLLRYLREHTRSASGRTYAGGLTKFEPKEIERLRVPDLPELALLGRSA